MGIRILAAVAPQVGGLDCVAMGRHFESCGEVTFCMQLAVAPALERG